MNDREIALKYGISPELLARVKGLESRGNNNAESATGALGAFQFTKSTWGSVREQLKRQGVELSEWQTGAKDPVQAATAAAFYLGGFNRKYNGREDLTYLAYNAGEGVVDRALSIQNKNGGSVFDIAAGLAHEHALAGTGGYGLSKEKLAKNYGGSVAKYAFSKFKEVKSIEEKWKNAGGTTSTSPVKVGEEAASEAYDPAREFLDSFYLVEKDTLVKISNEKMQEAIASWIWDSLKA